VRTRTPIDLDKTSKKTRLDFTLARGVLISGKFVDEQGHDCQITRSHGRAIAEISAERRGSESQGDFIPTDVDFRNKYRPKNCDGLACGSFNLGKGPYADGRMVFPTNNTFIIQGMMPGHTTFEFLPQKEGQEVLKILHGGQDILYSGIDTEPGQEIKDITIVIGKQ
jgi:hypothetical protein